MAEFQDRVLKCVDCGADFVFTAGEQHFYHDKNFKNEPKRCKGCKAKRQGGSGPGFAKSGNAHFVLAVRARDHRAFQAHAGTPGILPRVLPKPQDCTGCGGRGLELRELAIRSATAGRTMTAECVPLCQARAVSNTRGSRTGYNQDRGRLLGCG